MSAPTEPLDRWRSMPPLPFCRALDCHLPEFGDVIELDEVYATAGLKGREREGTSRTGGQQSRGRGSYDADQPPIIVLADRDSGWMYSIPATNADQSTITVILGVDEYDENDPITVCTDEFTVYDFLDEDDRFEHMTVTHGEGESVAENGDVHVNTCECQGSFLGLGSYAVVACTRMSSRSTSGCSISVGVIQRLPW